MGTAMHGDTAAPQGRARRGLVALVAAIAVLGGVVGIQLGPASAWVPPEGSRLSPVTFSVVHYEDDSLVGTTRSCAYSYYAVFDGRHTFESGGGQKILISSKANNLSPSIMPAIDSYQTIRGATVPFGQTGPDEPRRAWAIYDMRMSGPNDGTVKTRCDDPERAFELAAGPARVENTQVWSDEDLPAPPVADFTWTLSGTEPRQVAFVNLSAGEGSRTYTWDFQDPPMSTAENPVHTFSRSGSFEVRLIAANQGGSHSVTKTVTIPNALVVNSTGDAPAIDAAVRGCDTGGTIGTDPECTLRAAIQASNASDGGAITFDIPGGGVPVIGAAPLPAVAVSTTIDGTSQAGGWVAISGSGSHALSLTGGTSSVSGLAIGGATAAISITGGSGHVIEGNRLGTNPQGTASTPATTYGVDVMAPDVEVRDNVTGAAVGVRGSAAAARLEIADNALGVGQDRATPLGAPANGVLVEGPDTTVEGNAVRGGLVGILLLGPTAAGTDVTGNSVGVAGSSPLPDMGTAIRVDATPDVTVADNRAWGTGQGVIMVTGSKQYEIVDGEITLDEPSGSPREGPVTGGSTTITGNTLGLASGTTSIGWGVLSWADAPELTVAGNTVLRAELRAIYLTGGRGHQIVGNTLGTEDAPVGQGVYLFDAENLTIGGSDSSGNTIVAEQTGISLQQPIGPALVQGNEITLLEDAASGIGVAGDTDVPLITENTVRGALFGITTSADDATVTDNTVEDGSTGIITRGAGSIVTGNTVLDQTLVGIESRGDRSTVSTNTVIRSALGVKLLGDDVIAERNRVGVQVGSDTVVGNDGVGVSVLGGDATLTRNVVAGSTGAGIDVAPSAVAELRSNRIWESSDDAVSAPSAPLAPVLTAAIRTGSGDTLRRTLILRNLPTGDAGTIEVFANSSCEDPEARFVLEITRTKKADETVRVIQVKGAASRDHFTVTYTAENGSTSELSECVSGATYPDGDGDGSVDPLDEIIDAEDDPTTAIVATDLDQLLVLKVAPYDAESDDGGGQLEAVSVGEDPDPGGHPEGWGLPYGALSFRITDVKPGGHTTVTLTALSGSDPIIGTSYWKYGPQSPGGAEGWYAFAYDEATDTGAVLGDATDVPGVGIRRAFTLRFGDGARGDSDGGANGTITDPGGPVLYEGDPVEPPGPTTTTTTALSTTTTAAGLAPGPNPDMTPAGPSANGPLARTGTGIAGLTLLGLCLLGTGLALLAARRHRRSGAQA